VSAGTAVSRERTARYVAHVMGMPISLAMRGRHATDEAGLAAWAEVVDSLRAADEVFSTYRSDSVISRLGRGEITLADCPPEVTDVLDLGEQAGRTSGGAFSVWLPGPDGATLLDPSGVVKGWAAERAAEVLRTLPSTGFCLSAGGDIVCRTADPDGPPWRIGIEDPRDPSRVVGVVPVRAGAVATSGRAHRGDHVVDPRTGRAPEGIASVTVVHDDLVWADMDATAAYAMGPDAARWLRTRLRRTGLVVWADGSTELVGQRDAPVRQLEPSPSPSMTTTW
jgi:FAD:protein FMN transferase